MKVTEITSPANQKLKLIRSLAEPGGRKDDAGNEDLFLLEGTKLIQEALDKKIELIDVIVGQTYFENGFNNQAIANELDAIMVVPDRVFDGLYTTDTSCGIIATAKQKHYELDEIFSSALKSKANLLLLGDNLQDPGNLGTIIRTAYAFQAGGLVLSKGSADCYSPKVVRSSMGAIFSFPIVSRVDLKLAIDNLKANNFRIIALDSKAKKPFWEEGSEQPKVYILGNEGHGISPDILNLIDSTVFIPINPGCDSLNVAVAAGIILAQEQLKHAQ